MVASRYHPCYSGRQTGHVSSSTTHPPEPLLCGVRICCPSERQFPTLAAGKARDSAGGVPMDCGKWHWRPGVMLHVISSPGELLEYPIAALNVPAHAADGLNV